MNTNITNETLTVAQTLQQAIAEHHSGRLQEAEQLYRAILQTDSNHPEANYNLGVLAIQMQQPAAGLPHFITALNADPTCGQYWLSTIDALLQTDQLNAAREVLALAKQQGLPEDELDALAMRLAAGMQFAKQVTTENQHQYTGNSPSHHEINTLLALFNEGRHTEATSLAQTMTERFPRYGFGWKALGTLLAQMGRHMDALEPMQKAVALSPTDVETHYNLGNTLKNLGRLGEAEACYRQALEINPEDAEIHYNLGNTLKALGRLDEADACYQRTLKIKPGNADAHYNLGLTHQEQGRLDEAEACYRRALEINPNFAEAHSNLGNILKNLSRLAEAEASYRRALAIKPDLVEAHYNLGGALHEQGRLDEAEADYRRVLEIKPDYTEAHCNLGNTLKALGRLDEAKANYRRALEINPNFADAHYNLGGVLQELGRLDEAEANYRTALEIKPDFAEAHYNLGGVLHEQDRLDEAEACYRRALEIKPDYGQAHNNLGITLHALGRLNEAEACYRRALEIKPDFADAHYSLACTLQDLGRLYEAETSYRRTLEINPNHANAYNNLGVFMQKYEQLDAAVTYFRRALDIQPDHAMARSNLLFLYGYHCLIDPGEYLAQARNWEQMCLSAQERQTARHRFFQRSPLINRRLRVGYVSGDYRCHAMSYFLEQLFSHHDRTRIELFAYSTQGMRDAVTERLQTLVEHWIPLMGISDVEILKRIEADEIDVLIDLSGHTKHHRLDFFARRAAPVQAHYLGYFASTGLTEMDYWIGDDILTPAESASHFSEQVWRLPRVWLSYGGKADAPCSDWRPSQEGIVWLGSFNNLGKLTPATLVLWANLLHALPEAKLLLKAQGLGDMGIRQRIFNVLFSYGISSDRIELQSSNVTPDWTAHMAYYDRLDIALDPVGGVGGGTTTCDALWMGVPVITKKGDCMASRMTASMLNAIGHAEWIAHSEAEYIDKVVALARDVERRKKLRSSQRDRMTSSPLCDGRDLAISLENAYFEMFGRWLEK